MKVLYLGHLCEGTSWSFVAEEYIKALQLYTDVVWRPIVLTGGYSPRLINGNLKGCTHVIQHLLPNFMQKGPMPCVGLYVQESDSLKAVGWQDRLDMMDQVWTANSKWINKPYHIIPHCVDISIYEKEYPQPVISEVEGKFVFYVIGDFIRRKRFSALLEAFHLAFNRDDEVALLIKCGRKGMSEDSVAEGIANINQTVKKELKVKKCIDPVVITQKLTQEQIYGLHQKCDCYVTSSFGEGFGCDIREAMGFGNHVICGDIVDYLDSETSSVIPGKMVPCIGADEFVPNLHTGRDNWFDIDILALSKEMRRIYERGKLKVKNDMNKFSREVVGKQMYSLLKGLKC